MHGGSRRRRRDRLSGFRFFQVFRVPRPLFGNKPHEPRPFFGNNPMQCPPFFGNKPHAMPRARCRTLPRWGGRSRPASARPRRKPRLEAPPRRHESAGVFSLLVFSPSEPPRGPAGSEGTPAKCPPRSLTVPSSVSQAGLAWGCVPENLLAGVGGGGEDLTKPVILGAALPPPVQKWSPPGATLRNVPYTKKGRERSRPKKGGGINPAPKRPPKPSES